LRHVLAVSDLAISKAGVASWAFRYMIAGRAREMGLRPLRDINLSQARQLAYEARQPKCQGIDPIEARGVKQLDAQSARLRARPSKNVSRATLSPTGLAGRAPNMPHSGLARIRPMSIRCAARCRSTLSMSG
jgi:hypothetical protein